MSTLKEKAEQILQEKQEKIIPENFSSNLEIFDVQGNIYTAGGMSYFYDSFEYNENLKEYTLNSPDISDRYPIGVYIKPQQGFPCKLGININENTLANVINLTPEKIKKDETILGITGTYEGEQSSGIRKLDLDVSEQDVYIQDWPQEGDVICSIYLPEGIEETDLNNGKYTLDFIMKDVPYEAEWVRLDGLNLVIGNTIEMGIDLMIGIRLTENWEGNPAFGYKEVRISFSA